MKLPPLSSTLVNSCHRLFPSIEKAVGLAIASLKIKGNTYMVAASKDHLHGLLRLHYEDTAWWDLNGLAYLFLSYLNCPDLSVTGCGRVTQRLDCYKKPVLGAQRGKMRWRRTVSSKADWVLKLQQCRGDLGETQQWAARLRPLGRSHSLGQQTYLFPETCVFVELHWGSFSFLIYTKAIWFKIEMQIFFLAL